MNRAKWMGTGAFAAVLLSVAAEARAGSILRFADLTDTVIVTESTVGTTFIVRISNGEGYPDARAFTWTQTNALAAAATANVVFLYVINEQAGTDQTNQVSDGVLFRTTAGSQDLSVTFYSFDGSLPPALGGLTPYNDGQNGHPGPGIDADSFQVVPYRCVSTKMRHTA